MFLNKSKIYLLLAAFTLSIVNIFPMEARPTVACIENESKYILMCEIVKDISIKVADALYPNKDDREVVHSNFMAILRINTILTDIVKERYIEFAQIVISCDEEGIKYISRTFLDVLCNYERQDDSFAYIMEDIRTNYSIILETLERELNFKPHSLIVEDDAKTEVFKDIVRSLSYTIADLLFLDQEELKMARNDLYGIFFDIFRKNYEEIMGKVLVGKNIKILSNQLLREIYKDCAAFIRDYGLSDNIILQDMIAKINFIVGEIKAGEDVVLEKMQQVLMRFKKKPLLERIGYYAEKVRTGLAWGSATVMVLSVPAAFGGSSKVLQVVTYSGGIFISTTVIPKAYRKVRSLI